MIYDNHMLYEYHTNAEDIVFSYRREPVFRREGGIYEYSKKMLKYYVKQEMIIVEVETSAGNIWNVEVSFPGGWACRVRINPDGNEERFTPMTELPPPSALCIVEQESGILAKSEKCGVYINRDDFRIEFLDSEENILTGSSEKDTTPFKPITMPLGSIVEGNKVAAVFESLRVEPDEHILGLGEKYINVDKRGTDCVSWSVDTWGTNSTDLNYINVPFFMSSRGYAVYINTVSRIDYEIGSYSAFSSTFCVEDSQMDFMVFPGKNYRDLLIQYYMITGIPAVPPKWSFGIWMSRCMYSSKIEVEEMLNGMKERDIPVSVVHLDPLWMKNRKHHTSDACDFEWDEEAFKSPKTWIKDLAERGIRICLWENPYIHKDVDRYIEAKTKGYLLCDVSGNPVEAESFGSPAGIVDFTNPEVPEWWKNLHKPLFEIGVEVFKTDYGEMIPDNAVCFNGLSGRKIHNIYTYLYNRCVFEATTEYKTEPFIWMRSGYAGSHKFPLPWSGDAQCDFRAIASVIRAANNMSLSGFPFFSHDIGGFVGTCTPELYIRWAQFGMFSSHARFHGMTPREPWHFGKQAEEIVGKFARIRYSLIPYLYSQAVECVERLVPFMRSLLFDYPEDENCYSANLQYLLGDSIMVAPIYNLAGKRKVYFPKGLWHDFFTHHIVEGPQWLDIESPIDRIPVYVKDGTIIPRRSKEHLQNETEPMVELWLYGLRKGSFRYIQSRGREILFSITLRENGTISFSGKGNAFPKSVSLRMYDQDQPFYTIDARKNFSIEWLDEKIQTYLCNWNKPALS